jgi:hypothetical protein
MANKDNNQSQNIEDKDKEKEDVRTLPEGDRFKEDVEPPPADADNEDMV